MSQIIGGRVKVLLNLAPTRKLCLVSVPNTCKLVSVYNMVTLYMPATYAKYRITMVSLLRLFQFATWGVFIKPEEVLAGFNEAKLKSASQASADHSPFVITQGSSIHLFLCSVL